MIEPFEFITSLENLGIRFVTGVPDSLLKDFCTCIMTHFPPLRHIIATNEGSAVGLAIGHYLATGHPALVYMQNSGLGNAINPLTSLADPQVYGIPLVLMIGWRGEILSNGKQLHDEPQHVKQGQITLQQLELLDIPYFIVDSSTKTIEPILRELIELAMIRSGPVALVVRKKTFAPFEMVKFADEDSLLTREAAIAAVIAGLPKDIPIVSTTGKASRELFELRKAIGKDHHRDFLTVGGMGHAIQIAAGIALAKQDRQIVCIDGDGALLMHMGSLSISADCPNLLHIVINNGAHDSVGGQPTKGKNINFTQIARACNYSWVSTAFTVNEIEEIVSNIKSLSGRSASSFLEIKCRRGSRSDLGRPACTPEEIKTKFMNFILEKGDG
jgi:phosphonopyruvate decarboxylase